LKFQNIKKFKRWKGKIQIFISKVHPWESINFITFFKKTVKVQLFKVKIVNTQTAISKIYNLNLKMTLITTHFKIANHHKHLIQLSTHHLSLKIKNLKESICNSKAKL